MFLGLVDLFLDPTDSDLVRVVLPRRKMNHDTAALLHDRLDEGTLGSDDGLVMFGGDVDFLFDNIGLQEDAWEVSHKILSLSYLLEMRQGINLT